LGTGAALFALLLQLGLSFGHIHVAHADPPVLATATGPAGVPNGGIAQHPADDDHNSHHCAIYAMLALLAGAQVATSLVVLLPVALSIAATPNEGVAFSLIARHAPFRSRAPPLS
jgi:hypothetical protein